MLKKDKKVKLPVSMKKTISTLQEEVDENFYMCAFYVNGSQLDGSDPPHITPWETMQDCEDASRSYMDQLNAWWSATHPGEIYIDESSGGVLIDTVHPNVRVGTAVGQLSFNFPPGPTGSVLVAWIDGTEWQAV